MIDTIDWRITDMLNENSLHPIESEFKNDPQIDPYPSVIW